MKRKGLRYALPLACLLATGLASAADGDYGSGRSASDPGYNATTPSDRSMNADPSRPQDTQLPSDRSSSNASSSGTPMADSTITAKVKSALMAERDLPSTQIKVETNDGVVQLSGFLNSQSEIDRAVSVARNVKDVKAVENNMQTK